ncbi:vacuolar protein sorting-associated protein hypothetical protein [Limosa lapponica baueri]|uniref:Vta1/callose synthase N-terminal domain-containing protein n=1 Tax=Limosa lapponica baueri TaxID=1758121 RepID=A0A2I0TTQ1_LIMLA|nr:vacuolar protein sorting-associated protein hypothetical protein [Limosa lapponica baueri]
MYLTFYLSLGSFKHWRGYFPSLSSVHRLKLVFREILTGRLYAMQTGMKIDSKTPECRKFLSKLMDQLEAMKKQFGDNEAITQEIVGSAHVENYALKMFLYADNEDRAGQFHKNMIKSFYTASLLIDVLTVFGELSEENAQHRKYARWKAAYIHNCLKNGETPQPGPIGMEGESFDVEREEAGSSSVHSGGTTQPSSSSTYEANNIPTSNFTGIHIPPGAHAPANTPAEVPHNTGVTSNTIQPAPQNIPLVDPSLYSAQSAGKVPYGIPTMVFEKCLVEHVIVCEVVEIFSNTH